MTREALEARRDELRGQLLALRSEALRLQGALAEVDRQLKELEDGAE